MSQQPEKPVEVEDLAVNAENAEDVRGGAQVDYFLRLKGIDGEATSSREPGAPSISEVVVTKAND